MEPFDWAEEMPELLDPPEFVSAEERAVVSWLNRPDRCSLSPFDYDDVLDETEWAEINRSLDGLIYQLFGLR